jgi:hypothetical protein
VVAEHAVHRRNFGSSWREENRFLDFDAVSARLHLRVAIDSRLRFYRYAASVGSAAQAEQFTKLASTGCQHGDGGDRVMMPVWRIAAINKIANHVKADVTPIEIAALQPVESGAVKIM